MGTHRFEKANSKSVVGLTKTSGFQIGVRKTFALSVKEAWELLTSEAGMSIWLGEPGKLQLTKGETYTTKDGVEGEIRVVNPRVNLRLTWFPPVCQYLTGLTTSI